MGGREGLCLDGNLLTGPEHFDNMLPQHSEHQHIAEPGHAGAFEDQENYRWFGETVLIVRGRLISGGWQCDKCNAPLNRGHKAWLMTAFPRSMTAGMGDYDFAHEKRYFNMKRAEVAVYGAEWPGVAGASG